MNILMKKYKIIPCSDVPIFLCYKQTQRVVMGPLPLPVIAYIFMVE